MKTIIHVAQQAIQQNRKDGGSRPAIIVREGRQSARHSEVEIVAPDGTTVGRFVYQPHDPLPCGARLWLALEEGVTVKVPEHE